MNAKILVAELPLGTSIFDVLNDILDAGCVTAKRTKKNSCNCDCTTSRFSTPTSTCDFKTRTREPMGEPIGAWGIGGTPMDNSKRFGAAFHVDEPRIDDYEIGDEWKFASDKEAFDRFVDAGEDCAARGMLRPEGVTEHRVNAIRKRIIDGPAFPFETNGAELIGESRIWRNF